MADRRISSLRGHPIESLKARIAYENSRKHARIVQIWTMGAAFDEPGQRPADDERAFVVSTITAYTLPQRGHKKKAEGDSEEHPPPYENDRYPAGINGMNPNIQPFMAYIKTLIYGARDVAPARCCDPFPTRKNTP